MKYQLTINGTAVGEKRSINETVKAYARLRYCFQRLSWEKVQG